MGVKKSTVCTSARCRSSRYTPASSKVFELTSTLRPNEMGSCGKTCRRACWLNLEAHPFERRRLRDPRQWQTSPFQTRHRRLAGLRRYGQRNQEGKIKSALYREDQLSIIRNLQSAIHNPQSGE